MTPSAILQKQFNLVKSTFFNGQAFDILYPTFSKEITHPRH